MQIGSFNLSIIELKFKPIEKNYNFYGSYYRGMLGRYLKRRFCVLRDMKCGECPLNDKCLYMLTFERYKDALFPPYIINRAQKDRLRIVFVGSFSEFSEVFIDAFARQLEVKDAGFINPFSTGFFKQKIITNSTDMLEAGFNNDSLTVDIKFVRLKKDSKMIECRNLAFSDILNAIEKRIYLVNKYYGDANYKVFLPEFNGDFRKTQCKYINVRRYSNRQKRSMNIPSINVEFKISGKLNKIYPYLYLASLLNIGTNASMGFGELSITKTD
jgi:hypothetical protein